MSGEHADTPGLPVRKLRFPWPSALAGLLAGACLLVMSEPSLVAFYPIPADWVRLEVKLAVLGGFMLVLLIDLWRYQRRYQAQQADLKRLGQRLDDLRRRNRQLRLKVHTYSGHTDKLKLFISDKLLEYIEYDEKYLHFKGIAAEVRHNGVISFDKVQTALQQAAASVNAASRASTDTAADTAAADYREALDAMRYLWDLLDLSTADNLALHIGNLLYECEEHYYQRMLNGDTAAPLPYEPVFSPPRAAWRALNLVRADLPPMADDEADFKLEESQWFIHLAPVDELLGNENHFVLLLDNLLKNAQFFSGKRAKRSGAISIALTLRESEGHAVVRVYNRGPHIPEEDGARLFQLGYSTRRSRDHHGRGLGLYFAHEIVKGHDGRIDIRNIHTRQTRYELTLELRNGESIARVVEVSLNDGRPQCRIVSPASNDDGTELDEKLTGKAELPLPSGLKRVTITSSDDDSTPAVVEFDPTGKQVRLDPDHPERPHWRITYYPARKKPRLGFEAMDINGVEFEVSLPTARHRLESGEATLDEDIDAEMERLDERIKVSSGQGR
ncbi:MAG: ATP-binding protein [Wenzhouxiangellaceae bacterium]